MKLLRFGKKRTIMNKEFVPFEIAKRLKDLGFDDDTMAKYVGGNLIFHGNKPMALAMVIEPIPCPLYQQVFRWFRNKGIDYAIHINNECTHIYGGFTGDCGRYEFLTCRTKLDYQYMELELLNEMLNHLENQNKTHNL